MGVSANNLTGRLDRLRWSRFHTLITAALGVGWLLDSFEVNITGSVLGLIQKQFHLSTAEASWITSVWLAGIMVGALLFGYLADRFGRKKLFILTLVMYAVFTVLTALSPTFWAFMVLRFLTAIGVGAEYSAISSAIGELLPSKNRGQASAIVMNFWNVGALVAALANWVFLLLATWMFPTAPEFGWRITFAVGAVGALLVAYYRRVLPESPRWLLSKGRGDDARAVVQHMEACAGQPQPAEEDAAPVLPLPAQRRSPGFLRQVGELLEHYPGRVALGCLLDLSEAFGYYGLFTFLSLEVFPKTHIPANHVPLFYFLGNVGALMGGLVMAMFFDRLGRKVVVPMFYMLAALTTLLMSPAADTHNAWIVLAAFMVANFCASGAWTSAYPTFSEIFPTHLRATGIGLSVAVGRIGAMASGPLLVYIADNRALGSMWVFITMAGLWTMGALAMVPWILWGIEGSGTPLEKMVNVVPVALP